VTRRGAQPLAKLSRAAVEACAERLFGVLMTCAATRWSGSRAPGAAPRWSRPGSTPQARRHLVPDRQRRRNPAPSSTTRARRPSWQRRRQPLPDPGFLSDARFRATLLYDLMARSGWAHLVFDTCKSCRGRHCCQRWRRPRTRRRVSGPRQPRGPGAAFARLVAVALKRGRPRATALDFGGNYGHRRPESKSTHTARTSCIA
jgi:hypothetical protein